MPSWFHIAAPIIGTLVLALTYFDLFVTALTVSGAGPITRRLPPAIWTLARLVDRGARRARILPYIGMLTLLSIAMTWIVLLWLGWTLVYLADAWSVVIARTGAPVDVGGVVYYVGYSLFTLGLGDYRPQGLTWQLLSVLVSGTGLTVVTLIITYIVPVISAAAQRRALAARITTIGRTPEGILRRAWNGEDFNALGTHLHNLAQSLVEQAQQHHVYPILSNFHPLDPDQALTVRLAALDEAVLLLRIAVPPQARPTDGELDSFRDSMRMLLDVLPGADPVRDGHEPPPPDFGLLAEFGLPQPARAVTDPALESERAHRRRLCSIVFEEGWTWEAVSRDVHPPAQHPRGKPD
ncbi:hypothetical protein C882_1520 [Caenispirillum salinarum AK4]|uniref:Potassium channel domain-containing protein n=1 Tax=Caenispirillum salinarum AK4 TaxID=1238182 RepID=K9HR01_9PROT|nr:ion channel [Caenispirillum salinarum]EKV32683.1 hypothetical protein C882_1520 [Caenispirillum salinarum AK4]